jgi:hypothetical protein
VSTETQPRERLAPEAGDELARAAPLRLVVVQGESRPPVDAASEPMVMTFPHLLIRELCAFLALSLLLVVLSLLFDGPLEELANPERTPNPAKAPWYFLGLQELLHYYPPLISGVILPGLVILSLVVVPYFHVNLTRAPFARCGAGARRRRLGLLWLAVLALSALFYFTGAHPVWPVIIPLWLVALAASAPLLARDEPRAGLLGALARRSLPFWIYFWFLLVAVALTLIGVFFRGPGWTFTLPWRDGVFY